MPSSVLWRRPRGYWAIGLAGTRAGHYGVGQYGVGHYGRATMAGHVEPTRARCSATSRAAPVCRKRRGRLSV